MPVVERNIGDGGNRTHEIGPPWISAEVVLVPLCDRKGAPRAYALIDPADSELVREHSWSLRSLGRQEYPSAVINGRSTGLHIFLCSPPPGLYVDHINNWRLDNRRANLRLATPGENAQNQHARPGSSRYRGVCWDKSRDMWIAYALTLLEARSPTQPENETTGFGGSC